MTSARDSARFRRPAHLPGVELVTVSYRNRAFPMHTHAEYVIGTVMKGAERLVVRGSSHLVSRGSVLHLHPEEAHSNASIGAGVLCYRVFYLAPPSIIPYLDDEAGTEELCFSGAASRHPPLASILARGHEQLCRDGLGRLEQESGLAAIVDALTARRSSRARSSRDGGQAIRFARAWIDAHFKESFGLREVAAAAGLSVFRLGHLFKDVVGLSPIAFRNQRRVNEARSLLLRGWPIADVAAEVGFADQSHLTRQFQRIVGTSPLRYLQQ